MKALPFLLILSFNANAISSDACVEIIRSSWLLAEAGNFKSAEIQGERFDDLCLDKFENGELDEHYDDDLNDLVIHLNELGI